MKSFFAKITGITPELIADAKRAEKMVQEKAANLPYEVNREVMVLLPLKRYFEWVEQWETPKTANEYRNEEDKVWSNARAFLVPHMESDEAFEEFVSGHREYFLNSFVEGFSPKSRWPWAPKKEEFPEWFSPQLVGWAPWDMDASPLEKNPDLCLIPHEL